jgi:hypothetical protein
MATTRNSAHLRIVKDTTKITDCELLVLGDKRQRVCVAEQDVPMPTVDISLAARCAIDLGPTKEVFAFLPILWKGRQKLVRCAIGCHPQGRQLTLPRGTLAQWIAEAA